MKTLWITGASGVVGMKLVRQARAGGAFDRICAFTHGEPPSAVSDAGATGDASQRQSGAGTDAVPLTWARLDIGDRDAVRAAAHDTPPAVILNPAAMTNVDACETRRPEALAANAAGPRYLAEVACATGAHLLHVSTDYVFPGDEQQPGPYREDAAPRAINWYGETKLAGERAVAEVCDRAGGATPYTIVRTALVYGRIPGGRSNFVTWMAGELRAGRRVRIVTDQRNTPTLADDLAALLLWLAEHARTGIYHAAGPDLVGRDEWALAIARHFALDSTLIDWVTTAQLAQPAPRPRFSGLLCERLAADAREAGAPRPRGIARGLAEEDWGL